MIKHVYLKYAEALLMKNNKISKESDITFAHIKQEIKNGLSAFCVYPEEDCEGKDYVKFKFKYALNNASQNVFLSPNAITTEMYASKLYNAAKKVCDTVQDIELEKVGKVTQSQVPIAGEFCAFSDKP